MIPKRVPYSMTQSLRVRQADLGEKLGYLDTDVPEIVLHSEQPEIGKRIILLHELIHLVAEHLVSQGVIKRQPPEAFVENLAGGLFPMLALSGIWHDVSKQAVRRFYMERS